MITRYTDGPLIEIKTKTISKKSGHQSGQIIASL